MRERRKKKKVLFPNRRLPYEKMDIHINIVSFLLFLIFLSTFACWTKENVKGILIKTSQWRLVRKFICMNNSRSCVPYSIQLLVPHWLIFRSCSIAYFETQFEWMRLLWILTLTNDHDATNTHYSDNFMALLIRFFLLDKSAW
jgi:hypothetical protein